jgi:hypothetical protein
MIDRTHVVEGGGYGVWNRKIKGDPACRATKLRGDVLCSVSGSAGDHHRIAAIGETLGDHPAQAVTASNDHCCLHHPLILFAA